MFFTLLSPSGDLTGTLRKPGVHLNGQTHTNGHKQSRHSNNIYIVY